MNNVTAEGMVPSKEMMMYFYFLQSIKVKTFRFFFCFFVLNMDAFKCVNSSLQSSSAAFKKIRH